MNVGSLVKVLDIFLCRAFAETIHVYWPKKETSASHLCLLFSNECSYFIQLFCFNNVDHLAVCYAPNKNPVDGH